MSFNNLTPLEIRDLISGYQSDLRKLHFQVHKTNQIIAELKSYGTQAEETYALEQPSLPELPSASNEEDQAVASADQASEAPQRKTRRGRPANRKLSSEDKPKRGPGRPRKESSAASAANERPKGKGYRLSHWDNFVMDCLEQKQTALISADILDMAGKSESIQADANEIKIMLNRSLHKLANKKGLLVKVEYDGRGFAYAPAGWLNSRGELPKKYAR